MSIASEFDTSSLLKYLGLPQDFTPSPDKEPIAFLNNHLSQVPPHLLLQFSYITTPKQRTVMASIRNRRLQYANKRPPELQFSSGRTNWPDLWQGYPGRQIQSGKEERDWVQNDFLQGDRKYVGKLGDLLADYEDEREAERSRVLRRNRVESEFVPEEDSDSDNEDITVAVSLEPETEEEAKLSFERLVRERFIYGLLDNIDYDKVDWDESLGVENDREEEERWFNDDEDE